MTISKTKLLIILLVIGCQGTDITIGPMKFWEVMAICALPFFTTCIDKKLIPFAWLFLSLLVISFLAIITNNVEYEYFGLLKSKYIISIVRTIELLLCLVLANSIFNLKYYNTFTLHEILKIFINYNFILVLITLLLYSIDITTGSRLVSDGQDHRLRAFYVEGGPYGLYISTLFFIEYAHFKRYIYLMVFLSVIFFAKSKSGYIFAIIGFLYLIFSNTKQLKEFVDPQKATKFLFIISLSIPLIIILTYFIGINYVNSIKDMYQATKERPTDTSLVMGRVAGSYIGYNIITNNPILGVGSGNYSLVRNNTIYRGFIPSVNKWDLGGLGGIFNLLIENGIIGLSLFILTIFNFFRLTKYNVKYFLLFILPFCFGAQLYWVYPWAYIGFYRLSETPIIKVK